MVNAQKFLAYKDLVEIEYRAGTTRPSRPLRHSP